MAEGPNVLDKVLLTPSAANEWHRVARQAVLDILDTRPDEIPDEQAQVLPNGYLRIYVESLDGTRVLAELTLPAIEWCWAIGADRD